MVNDIKRTERGWAGHFCCSAHCGFRRNTLLEYMDTKIIVSTVGNMRFQTGEIGIEKIGLEHYYETMAFRAEEKECYIDANVSEELEIPLKTRIIEISSSVDNEANDMHEEAVNYFIENIKYLDIIKP